MEQDKRGLRDRFRDWRRAGSRKRTPKGSRTQSPTPSVTPDAANATVKDDRHYDTEASNTGLVINLETTTIGSSTNVPTDQTRASKSLDLDDGNSSNTPHIIVSPASVADSLASPPSYETASVLGKAATTKIPSVADESSILWREAYEEFRKENTSLLEHYEAVLKAEAGLPQSDDLRDQLATIAAIQAKRASNRQWRFQWSGKKQSVRDLAGRILDLTSKAADLVAIGMGFAPPYVSIPWAAVTALVPFMVNDIKEHQGALEGLEIASKVVLRYQMVERTFLGRDDTREVYKKSVMALYKKIIEYQALATQYFRGSTLRRLGRNVLGSSAWQSMPSTISAIDNETRYSLQFLGQQTQATTLTNITDLLRQQEQQVNLLIQRASAEREEVAQDLQLISAIATDRDHKDVRKKLGEAHFLSGHWFLEHSDVQAWNDWTSNFRVLWLRDGVGTGKSSLTSILVENLMRSADGVVAYFYCSRKYDQYDKQSSARDDNENIMRSLVAQIAVSPDGSRIVDVVARRLDRSRRRNVAGIDLSIEECVTLLEDVLSTCNLRSTIVIDALDECNDYDRLLQSLSEATTAHSNVRLFFSSRLQVKIQDYFPDARVVPIQTHNVVDIERFLDLEMPQRRIGSGMTDSQSERLRKILIERAGSMFMWVKLQLNLFLHEVRSNRIRFEEDIEPMLIDLENSKARGEEQLYIAYNDVYNAAIGTSTEKRRKEIVTTALRWVLSAYRTLTLRELTYATLVMPDGSTRTNIQEGLLLELCSNLIVEDTMGAVRLAHLSVRHFLETRNPPEYQPDLNHLQAALSCLYLASSPLFHKADSSRADDVRDGDGAMIDGYHSYVSSNWFKHCRYARKSEQLNILIDNLPSKSRSRSSASKLATKMEVEAGSATIEIPEIVSTSLEKNATIDNEISLNLATDTGTTRPELDVFAKLLDSLDDTPEECLNVITHYIAKGFDLDVRNQFSSSLLHEVVRFRRQDAIQILLDIRVPTESSNHYENTPLHTASIHRNVEGTRMLLYFGADANARNVQGETPLHLAITHRVHTTAEMLLAAGADVSAKDHDGNAPLHLATLAGDQSFVETLLLSGCDPNGQNKSGKTALMMATDLGHTKIAALLLQHKALRTSDENLLALAKSTPELIDLILQNKPSSLTTVQENISDDTIRHTYKASIEYNNLTSLCGPCNPVRWLAGFRKGMTYRHHESLEDLYISADSGCAMCSFLRDELAKDREQTDVKQEGFLTVTVESSLVQASPSHPHDRFVLSIKNNRLLDFELCTDPDDSSFVAAEWISGRTYSADPLSDRCLSTIKNWMRTCFNEHQECHAVEASQLPTRLIDIGESSSSRVSLVTTDKKERGLYVYLSARWGIYKTDSVLTNRSPGLVDGWPLEQLAQTFQDAIFVTRRLGYRYIWIDALCIIQGSAEDFEYEAPRMDQYYQNAAFVLVAAGSAGFLDNLLYARRQPILTINFMRLPDTDHDNSARIASPGTIYLRKPLETVYHSLKESSLSRGWMVAEVVVASRHLIVGKEQMYWHCRTHTLSEGSTLQRDPVVKLLPCDPLLVTSSQQRTFFPWYNVVSIFSEARLTRETDRAVATLVMAKYFNRLEGYVVGLWEQDIRNGLLWHVDNSALNREQSLLRALSWSWTSMAAPVRYDLLQGAHHTWQSRDAAFAVVKQDQIYSNGIVTIEAMTLDTTALPEISGDCMFLFDSIVYEKAWRQRLPFLLVFVCPWSMTPDSCFDPNRARGLGLVLCQLIEGSEHQETHYLFARELNYSQNFLRAGLFLSSSYDQEMEHWIRRRVLLT